MIEINISAFLKCHLLNKNSYINKIPCQARDDNNNKEIAYQKLQITAPYAFCYHAYWWQLYAGVSRSRRYILRIPRFSAGWLAFSAVQKAACGLNKYRHQIFLFFTDHLAGVCLFVAAMVPRQNGGLQRYFVPALCHRHICIFSFAEKRLYGFRKRTGRCLDNGFHRGVACFRLGNVYGKPPGK